MIEDQVLVKKLRVNYKTFGAEDGKPFLILHGWGSKSDRWVALGELVARKNIRVIVPDLPGFGDSQEPESAWNLDNYVDWVQEFTQTIPELKNEFYLLGHSFGGAICVKYAIKYAQRVEKVFLFGAAVIRKKTIKKQVLSKISPVVKMFAFLPFYDLGKRAFYKFVIGGSDYLRVDGVMKQTFLKAISEDLSQKLLFIKIPTVIIWGNKDDTTLVEDAYYMNKKIDNSKLVIIEGGDHDLEQKMPETLSEKILENI